MSENTPAKKNGKKSIWQRLAAAEDPNGAVRQVGRLRAALLACLC